MGNNIVLRQEGTGLIKEAKVGYSWTNLFFGVFTPLIRGDWKWLILQGLASVMTYGFSWIVFPFIYNKLYIKDLIEKGYRPVDERSLALLERQNIL